MTKTTRIALVAVGLVAAGVAAYRLIPALKQLSANLRRLQLILEDIENSEDEESGEMYRVGSIDITDPEILRRVDEALKDHPEGWITRERPVRHSELKEDDESS